MRKLRNICFIILLSVVIMISVQAPAIADHPSSIRIGLFYDKTAKESYELHSDDGFVISQGDVKSYEINDRTIEIKFVENKGLIENALYMVSITSKDSEFKLIIPSKMDSPVFFENRNRVGVIALNGRRYRGRLKIWPSEFKRLTVVNELGLEEYLYGVIPKEMPASWPLEALKAQAVAARTYAICNLSKWEKYGFDLSDGVSDQAYEGYDAENANTNMAVDETRGMLILYENEPIQAFYHSDSGGVTESGSEVTGSNLPYLLSVEDVVKTNSPNSSWELIYSPEDIRRQIISMKGIDLGEIYNVSIIERTSSNRAKKLQVSGTLGEKEFSGSEIRSVFQLKSNLFEIVGNSGVSVISKKGIGQSYSLKEAYAITADGISKVNSNNAFLTGGSRDHRQINLDNTYGFRFVGRGWGHGLGMSQWGARTMAENGYNYINILQHYYNNVEIR